MQVHEHDALTIEQPLPYTNPDEQVVDYQQRIEEKQINPMVQWAFDKTSPVLGPVVQDISESDGTIEKTTTILAGAAFIGSQVLDRARIAIILVPEVATRVLEETQSPTWTGIAAGGMNYLWTFGVGEAATQGLNRYPNTVNAFTEKFPKFVDFFQQGLPGLEDKHTESKVDDRGHDEKALAKRALENTVTHLKRAGVGMGLGSTAFVATSKTLGYKPSEMRKENHLVALDTSLLVGAVGWGLGSYVTELANRGDFETVETVASWVGNSKNWLAVAGGLITVDYISKKVQAKKEARERLRLEVEIAEANRTRLPEQVANKITTPKAWAAVGILALAHKTLTGKPGRIAKSGVVDVTARMVISMLNKKKKLDINK